MIRDSRFSRRLTALVGCLAVVGAPHATAFTEDQWRCVADADGEWQCGEVAAAAGPFEPAVTAPIYSRAEAQAAARGEPGVIFGQTPEQAELTWVPRQALPQRDRLALPEWCNGAYQEQAWTDDELFADPATTLIGLSADRGEYVIDQLATLEGVVTVEQGARRVSAEMASFDVVERALMLEGDVLLKEPGVLLRGASAQVDLVGGDARVEDARFVFYDGGYRGSATTLQRTSGDYVVEDGSFTRCEPGDEGWKIAAGRIEIPEDANFAIARNAKLEIYDIPVFYSPYLRVPITDERQSGFLFPSMGYSGENGVDISAPYYFNLAENYDATLAPRVMTERGVLLELEMRQLTGAMRNSFGGAYMPQDDNYDGEVSFDEFKEQVKFGQRAPGVFNAEDRWLAQIDHRGSWFEGVTTELDFVAVSDRDYFRDLGTNLSVNSQPEIVRTGAVRLRRGGLDARVWAEDIQVLQDNAVETYQRLPQFDVSWHERFGDVPMVFGLDAHHAEFDQGDGDAVGTRAITGTRTHIVPRFTLPVEWSWGWAEAKFAYQYTRWDLENTPAGVDDGPSRTLPMGSLDVGLRYERDTSIAGNPLLQTLEPRAYYLYIEDENQDALPLFDTADLTFGSEQLFRENRFSGVDRIGDADQLTLAVTSRLLTRGDGSELGSITVGTILYFDDRDVNLSGSRADVDEKDNSGWVTDLVLRLGGGFDAKALWVWDNENGELDQGNYRLRYRDGGRRIFNIGYRTRGQNIEQLDVNFTWPYSQTLSVVGRMYYDLQEDEAVEGFGGLQYDDCCWRLRLVGRRYLRPTETLERTERETGVFVEVVMKGLAGFDSGLGSVLDDGIEGFNSSNGQDNNGFRF